MAFGDKEGIADLFNIRKGCDVRFNVGNGLLDQLIAGNGILLRGMAGLQSDVEEDLLCQKGQQPLLFLSLELLIVQIHFLKKTHNGMIAVQMQHIQILGDGIIQIRQQPLGIEEQIAAVIRIIRFHPDGMNTGWAGDHKAVLFQRINSPLHRIGDFAAF